MADAEEATNYGVFGVGNALLDVSAEVGAEVLEQYELKPANAVLAEGDKYDGLFKTLSENPKVQYIPGGATMNVVRIANWMLQGEKKCSLSGILGQDNNGKSFKEGCDKEGLEHKFYEQNEKGTGRCAVCIVDKDRSMVADLLCNDLFPQKDPDFLFDDCKSLWQNADICYISGFWLTVNPEGMKRLAEYCQQSGSGRKFVTNISAPFIAAVFLPQLKTLFPYIDILFGNESEAEALAGALNLEKQGDSYDLKMCAKEFAKLLDPKGDRGTRVIITQGGDPVIVAKNSDAEPATYEMPALAKEEIVDFNGAGDGFAGGFLAGMVMGKTEKVCIDYGAYSAQFIIKRSGVQFGKEKPQYPDA